MNSSAYKHVAMVFDRQTFQYQKGQVLLIVVLVVVVILTIALSAATRSVTNQRLSTEEEESKKAFSAAEAGIEQSLETGSAAIGDFGGTGENQAGFNASISDVSGTFAVNDGSALPKNDGIDIWLSEYGTYANGLTSGTFQIVWGTSNTQCSNAALEVVVVTGTKDNPRTLHRTFDPCNGRRMGANGNNFSSISSGTDYPMTLADGTNKTFYYRATISGFSGGNPGLIARVIPLYFNTPIAVVGNLPKQGERIESTGVSGEAQRKIQVTRSYPKFPNEYFPFIVFSP